MYEKITRKNSIIYNQLWINKLIEERHIELLPFHKISNLSIGEYIETIYNKVYGENYIEPIKISKKNSLLFEREWIEKFKEEKLSLPTVNKNSTYSLAELMEIKYKEIEVMKENKQARIEKCLKLNV